jgi:ABC-type sugar transport system ATPase subunit
MRAIQKRFPGVRALRGVDLDLGAGEVLAVVGENGAGKSTLIKVLSGAHAPDSGTVHLEGREASFRSPLDAQRAGIAVIYQELNLVPSLNARENLFLGREVTRCGFLRRRQEHRAAREVLTRLGVEFDTEAPCRSLSVAQRQVVEIAKALVLEARVLVLDEPSATLSPEEVRRLFGIIRELQGRGLGIIYISHRLEEVFEIADRVLVLRDGERVAEHRTREVSRDRLIELMVGRRLENEFPPRQRRVGAPRLVVRDLRRRGTSCGVSFVLHRGEVLGLAGLVGAGRTEIVRLIAGADRPAGGEIELDGRQLRIRSPRDAIRSGIVLLSEDRKGEGLVLSHSSRENFGLPNLRALSRLGFVRRRRERSAFASHVEGLRIRLAHQDQPARELSGGNQQKVVLAKWLESNAEVLVFDEPTRGIDVGAKYEIYVLIQELVEQGKSVLMVSSELPELLGMCDRILVLHEGRLSGEISDVPGATQEDVLRLAVG